MCVRLSTVGRPLWLAVETTLEASQVIRLITWLSTGQSGDQDRTIFPPFGQGSSLGFEDLHLALRPQDEF